MSETQGMDQETIDGGASTVEIPVSGDALAIADAIYSGLTEGLGQIAAAIKVLAAASRGDEGEPQEPMTYMDGTPIS